MDHTQARRDPHTAQPAPTDGNPLNAPPPHPHTQTHAATPTPLEPQDYLSKCISHLLSVLRHPSERGAAFGALADMATSLAAVGCAGGFKDCLPAIAAQVRGAVEG